MHEKVEGKDSGMRTRAEPAVALCYARQMDPANSYCSLAPYEKRVIELLRNSKDKRARRLAKKRVRLPTDPP